MTKQFLKVILAGVLAGVAIFMMPFIIIRIVIFFLIIGLIFRLVGGRRRRWGYGPWSHGVDPQKRYAFAKRWHNMSANEKTSFKEKMEAELFGTTNNPTAENK